MNRRGFLKGIAVLPVLPAVVRDWAWERAEAAEEAEAAEDDETPRCIPEPKPKPPDSILAYAEGEPTAVTVAVTGNELLKITATAFMTGISGEAAEIRLYEDKTLLAVQQAGGWDLGGMHIETMLHPTPGSHTYRLSFKGNVVMDIAHRPAILVEKIPPTVWVP